MSKPDFFLPFHLPMLAEGSNKIFNIDCPLENEPDGVKNDVYFCRLHGGVYQTMQMCVKKISYDRK